MRTVTKRELATYYELRRTTEDLKITDDRYPRPSIPRCMPIEEITYGFFLKCYKSELHTIVVGFKMQGLDGDIKVREATKGMERLQKDCNDWRNEAMENRGEINSLRRQIGLQDEE